MLTLALALACQSPSFEPFPPSPFDRVQPITIDEQDALLAGHGRAERVAYKAEFSGTLHVWTRAAGDIDLFLRLETPGGELVKEDDDSGGGKTPYVRLEVEPGRELVFLAAMSSASAPIESAPAATRFDLCAIAAPETAETRAAAEAAQVARAEVERMREAKDLDRARARATDALEELLDQPGASASEIVSLRAWELGFETNALSILAPTRRAWTLALRHRSRTLPEEHPDLQAARLNLAVAIKALGDLHGARALEEEVLEVRSRTLPEDHPALQGARQNLAWTIQALGDLHGARALEEQVLEVRSRTLPEDHSDLQAARLNLAGTMHALGDLQAARALLEQVLGVLSRTLPEEHPSLLTARQNLAKTIMALGDLQGARALQEQVLEVRSRTLPEDHPDLQAARGNLAATIKALGDLQGARALQEQVLEVCSRTLPEEHPHLQVARQNLALTLKALGDPQGARALQEQALGVFSRTLPDDHPDLQVVRGNLAATMNSLGDLQGAHALFEHVYGVSSRTLPEDHPDLQMARQNLAVTRYSLGDLAGAHALLERVLEVLSRALPEDHPDLQGARQNLAVMRYFLGDLQGARALQEQVLEVRSRTLPEDHPDLQGARQNLAGTIQSLGDLQGARALEEQVLDVCSRTLPEDHSDLQAARLNLAGTMHALGDLQAARALLEHVLGVRSRTLPEEHPGLLTVRQNLAVTIKALGDLDGARALEEEVLEVRSRTLPEDHPDLQAARGNLAATMYSLGDLQAARTLLEQVLGVQSRTLPEDHPDLQWSRQVLAATILAHSFRSMGEPDGEGAGSRERERGKERAAALLSSMAAAQARVSRAVRADSPGREAEERCASLAKWLDFSLSVGLGYGSDRPAVVLQPAVFAYSEATRNASISSSAIARLAAGSERSPAARERLRKATDELARIVQGRTASSGEFHRALQEREAAEEALLALGRELSGGRGTSLDLDVVMLSAALKPSDAAVAYRAYTRSDLRPPDQPNAAGVFVPEHTSVESLCAFVVRPRDASSGADATEALTLLDLGPIEPIRAAVEAWRTSIGADGGRGVGVSAVVEADARPSAARDIRRLVFDPLMPALGGAEHVVLVLDDLLHLVPFDALPAPGPEGQLLGDVLRIEIRATLGELLDGTFPFAGGEGFVGLGGASFDLEEPDSIPAAPGALVAAAAPSAARAPILRGGAFQAGFGALPATRAEVDGIADEYRARFGARVSVVELTGAGATREALLAAAPRARWLHVATHGWLAPSSMLSWDDARDLDAKSGLAPRSDAEQTVKGMSPMLLCGLALAGANLPEDALGRVPGLVSADELSSLDLSNCELAVLSACDTARGDIRRAGQGVASLQKALQIAGARSVITSLWKVPDEATKDLMLDFYRRVWVEKTPKGQALWEAKTRLREARDERGDPKYALRDWAAWVLTGEPD